MNPPWIAEGAPEWSSFYAWYKDLIKDGYHSEAQRIQIILLPRVTPEEATKTFISIDLLEVVEDMKETGYFDESLVLSMLVITNTVCDYLLEEAAKSKPQLANIVSTYLDVSRFLKAELSWNSTFDSINKGLPLKWVDELYLQFKLLIPTTKEVQPRPLVLLGDGSWCGREADTKSNIYLLARMIRINMKNIIDTDFHIIDNKAWYIYGISLGK
ncbi:hypothetical protein DER44DRAFT_746887 [Fusarium oxysporum]|nr:hypothetical protein DER44DRAFT_746887 [Fusarium oxysporum]